MDEPRARRLRAVLGVALCVLALPAPGRGATAAERLERAVPRLMRAAKLPGLSAVVVRGGAVVWQRAWGLAAVTRGVPVRDDTVFMLASVSKTVTGVALMQLADDGVLALDAPLDPYVPFAVRNPRFPDHGITARMLLSHTSSIADGPACCDAFYVPGDSTIPLRRGCRPAGRRSRGGMPERRRPRGVVSHM